MDTISDEQQGDRHGGNLDSFVPELWFAGCGARRAGQIGKFPLPHPLHISDPTGSLNPRIQILRCWCVYQLFCSILRAEKRTASKEASFPAFPVVQNTTAGDQASENYPTAKFRRMSHADGAPEAFADQMRHCTFGLRA